MQNQSYRDRISDLSFRQAVDLIDAGDVESLRTHLTRNPGLVSQLVEYEGNYFTCPTLLHFVAENPIRNGRLPANISDVAEVILKAGADVNAASHEDNSGSVLALVASGMVPRKCDVQEALMAVLVKYGADPNSAIWSALSQGEHDAASALVKLGATIDLIAAAGLGRLEEIRQLLSNADDLTLRRALAAAVINRQVESARLLLPRIHDPEAFNPDGFHTHSTPLHQAVANDDPEMAAVLLDHGAQWDRPQDKLWGGTPCDWAIYLGKGRVIVFFASHGFAVNLQQAAAWNAMETVKSIIESEPERVNEIGEWGTALQQAAYHNRHAIAEFLLIKGADPNQSEGHEKLLSKGIMPLDIAIERDQKLTINELIRWGGMTFADWQDATRETHQFQRAVCAIKQGDIKSLRRLLDDNPALAQAYQQGSYRTLLHVASDWPGHFPNVTESIQLLIEKHANPNARGRDGTGETPLHGAASSNDVAALDALIDGGADINARGAVIANGTPLTDACAFRMWQCAERLVECGAGYDLWHASALGRLDLMDEFFTEDGKFIIESPRWNDCPDGDARFVFIAFWLAAQSGRLKMLRYLRDKIADINEIGPGDQTALDRATFIGITENIDYLQAEGALTAKEVQS
ncbi:ankyrin repeat domain-containing protein [Rubellicoccus peritrichatus]|uniref:Ankyrin repeat domain-containing protein n=1 Tax=Rubellicoccus peritrichatus TaxID=3080537 RepID=A0AAQ3L942_9BACT|nr:ankyrin repeat domain-containing protein [Puniceicoccus sp. CR14]WOO41630.1 ankyrin repeat domain-containing protein [Puniceicoccus sp. CR14]